MEERKQVSSWGGAWSFLGISEGAPRGGAEEKEPASQTRAQCLREKKVRGGGHAGGVRPQGGGTDSIP